MALSLTAESDQGGEHIYPTVLAGLQWELGRGHFYYRLGRYWQCGNRDGEQKGSLSGTVWDSFGLVEVFEA